MNELTERKLAFARRAFDKPPTTRDRIWRSMRILRRFNILDLLVTAEASYGMAQRYVGALVRVGFVKQLSKPGARLVEGAFLLVRNTGALAPLLVSEGVFDPNTRTTWTQEGPANEV